MKVLTLTEAGDHLGLSRDTVRRMVDDHGLPHAHRGRIWLFRPDLLDDAVAAVMDGTWTPVPCPDDRCSTTLKAVS